ncbi:MAG: RNA polymerase sigma factor [Chloroflexota bacterium]
MVEDGDLTARARRGDLAAYEELVRRYQDLAFRTAFLVLRDADEAHDAAQVAFIKAYDALDRFRPDAPFRPWLLKIAVNEARNRLRSAGRRANLQQRVERVARPIDAADSPEQHTLSEKRNAELRNALDQLSEMDRLVIGYRYFFDLSEAEMAETLGIPRWTVKSRLSRALGRLREIMRAGASKRTFPGSVPWRSLNRWNRRHLTGFPAGYRVFASQGRFFDSAAAPLRMTEKEVRSLSRAPAEWTQNDRKVRAEPVPGASRMDSA